VPVRQRVRSDESRKYDQIIACLLKATEGQVNINDTNTIIRLITNYINNKARQPSELRQFMLDTIDTYVLSKQHENLPAKILCSLTVKQASTTATPTKRTPEKRSKRETM